MSIFDISPTRTQEVSEAAARSGGVEFGQTGIEPSWYSFNIDGSAWKSASAAADLAKVEATYQLTDPEYRGPLEAQRQAAIKAAQDAKPDQRFNGALGNVMHTLGEMGYLFAGSAAVSAPAGAVTGGTFGLAGGPVVAAAGAVSGAITGGVWGGLLGSNAILATRENILLQESGVSPAAARSVAGITGILGAFAPAGGKVVTPFTSKIASFLGNSFSSKASAQIVREAAETAVGNIAINATGRGVQSTILEQSGYAEQAKDYHALDATAMLVDGVLGAAFGSGGKALHLRSERAKAAREAAGTDGSDGGPDDGPGGKGGGPGSPPAGAGDPIPTVHALMDTGGGPLDGLLVTIDPDQAGARNGVSVAVVLPDGTRHITGIRTIDIEAAKGATVPEPKVETVQVDTPTLESEGIQSTQITPSDVDLALALNNAVHNETSNPFGIPTDKDTSIKHHENVAQIESDMYHDTQLTILHDIADGSYIPDPAIAAHQANHDAVITQLSTDLGGPEVVGRIIPAIEAAPVAVPVAGSAEFVGPVRPTVQPIETTLPSAVKGNEASVKVNDAIGYQPVVYALIDGATHEATIGKADNQFRDRTRPVSQLQIDKIANAPDYNLLNQSPTIDMGSPILDPQGNIVSGNGRMAGINKAYDIGTGDKYKTPMLENLAQFGIDPAAADGMKKPVLVRIMRTDIDTKTLAIASNEGGAMRMSALEQAKVDASRLPDLQSLKIADDGSVPMASNAGAIMHWVGQFPIEQQAGLLDKGGDKGVRLSVEGQTRLRNALIFEAFGDSSTLSRLIESTDAENKNVANALAKSSATIAEVKQGITDGSYYPIDISADIVTAVETFADIKQKGAGTVADFLNQGEMFGVNQMSPEARLILQFFAENLRSGKTMSEMINTFYDRVKALGDPKQADIFASEPPTKGELLAQTLKDTGKKLKEDDLFAQPMKAADQKAAAENPQLEANKAYAENDAEKSIVNPIDPNASPAEKVRQLNALTEENKPIVQRIMDRIDILLGTESKSNKKADDKIIEKSVRPSILDEKPWYSAEHIRDSFRFKTVIETIDQLPKAVSILQHELNQIGGEIIKPDLMKIVSPKEFGWRIAVFDLKMPNGQLVEYYLPLKRMEEAKKNGGHQIFESVRNLKASPENFAQIVAARSKSTEHYSQAFNEQLAHEGKTMADVQTAVDETQAVLSKPSSERASVSSASASRPLTASYPSSKSPILDSGAGDLQFPRKDLTAEKSPGPNSQATLEPVSDLNAINGPSDKTSTSVFNITSNAVSDKIPGSKNLNEANSAGVVPEKGPRVDAILEDRPDLRVSDKDGSATNAPDFLSEAERDILKSVEDGKDIEVAISCELRG